MVGTDGMDGTGGKGPRKKPKEHDLDRLRKQEYLSLEQFSQLVGSSTTTIKNKFMNTNLIEHTDVRTPGASRPSWRIHRSQIEIYNNILRELGLEQKRKAEAEAERLLKTWKKSSDKTKTAVLRLSVNSLIRKFEFDAGKAEGAEFEAYVEKLFQNVWNEQN